MSVSKGERILEGHLLMAVGVCKGYEQIGYLPINSWFIEGKNWEEAVSIAIGTIEEENIKDDCLLYEGNVRWSEYLGWLPHGTTKKAWLIKDGKRRYHVALQ